jgi:hypothetical protein
MGVLSPDEKFFLVGTTFDLPIAISGTYPNGSPILWVQGPDGKPRSVAPNAPDPDGIAVFRVNANGTLTDPSFSRTEGAVLLSTSPSSTINRTPSSSDMPSVTASASAALTKTAELASTRSYQSTQGEARSLNFAGYPSPPMTLRFSGTAMSPASLSTAPRSESRRILHAPKSRAMARSGGFVET